VLDIMYIVVGKLISTVEWPGDKIFRKNNEVVFGRCFCYELFSFCKILLRSKLVDCKLGRATLTSEIGGEA
jgi:hypothetical protein